MKQKTAGSDRLLPTRRNFLIGASALTFVVGTDGTLSPPFALASQTRMAPNIWLSIETSGKIRIIYPNTEMGQGSSSALPTILTDELDADWNDVIIEQLNDDNPSYGDTRFGGRPLLYTAGSGTVRSYFNRMRLAGAQARKTLMIAAAQHWGVPVDRLVTDTGIVLDPVGGRQLSYGKVASLWDGSIAIPEVTEADLKDPEDFRYIGRFVPRIDIPDKTKGDATYAIDVRVPNMLYASVLRAPVEGETVISLDDSQARSMTGVEQIVHLPDGIAVVADHIERAFAARDALKVTWSETSPFRSTNSEKDLQEYEQKAQDLNLNGTPFRQVGDAKDAIANAGRKIERTYLSDYAYHAQMEPMAVVASVDNDQKGAEVWAGTQTQTLTTSTITNVLETTPDKVRLHMMTMGGSYGRRAELMQNYVRDALLSSIAVMRPVKVVWTREDDLMFGAFRPIAAQVLRAGLSDAGSVVGWQHRVATPSVIEYFNPERWKRAAPRDGISVLGSHSPFYSIPNFLAEHIKTERRARIMPWRATATSYTLFAAESFVDEVAVEAGRNVVDFRRELLREDPSGLEMLDRVLEMSNWSHERTDTALGLSLCTHGPSHGIGAVEISLDRENGSIKVENIWAAFDAGLVVSPANARAQLEGGLVFGVSCALREVLTIDSGEVQQSNFHDYEILRADEVPNIEIEIMQRESAPTGIGELSTGMVPAAIANAFYALTRRRLRHMPFTPDRVKRALS